jgi:restriction endonuclease S subunit
MSQFIEMFGDPMTNPKGWPVMTMKESSTLLSDGPFGSNLKTEHYCETGIRVIRLQNICLGYFDDTDKAFISEQHYEKLRKYTCRPGEIVIGTLGEPNFRACVIPNYIQVSINKADCVHYIPKEDLLDCTFACAYINCERTLQMATSNIHGTTRARIAAGQVNNIPIYIPPLDMQKRFVTMVQQSDKSEFVGFKSQFIEMFYNETHPVQQLTSHIEVLRGVSYKPSDVQEAATSSNSTILRSNNIYNGQINYDDVVFVDSDRVSDYQVVSEGDIVMCGSNGSKSLVGKAALIDSTPLHRTSFGAFCLGIRCKNTVLPKYLATYFQTSLYRNVIESLGSGSNILNIKPEHIYNLEIPIPTIEEQQRFVLVAEQADKSEKCCEFRLAS